MAKDLSISILLDFYGDMLTEKQREVIELYYNADLSLAEISGLSGITRQGVRGFHQAAEAQLLEYESASAWPNGSGRLRPAFGRSSRPPRTSTCMNPGSPPMAKRSVKPAASLKLQHL